MKSKFYRIAKDQKKFFDEEKHLEEKYKIGEVRQKINKILDEYDLKFMVNCYNEACFITPDGNAVRFEKEK